MKRLNIKAEFLQHPLRKEELKDYIQGENPKNELMLVHCAAPKENKRYLQVAFDLARNGGSPAQPLEHWFSAYAQQINSLFHPLKRNALLIDLQLLRKELVHYFKFVEGADEIPVSLRDKIMKFNHLANELIVAALFQEAEIEVGFYAPHFSLEDYSIKEKKRMFSDFDVLRSVQKNCVIFLQCEASPLDVNFQLDLKTATSFT